MSCFKVNKLLVAMDMDGVIYPFDKAFNELMEQYGGERQEFSKFLDFSTMPGRIIESVWNDPTLFTRSEPYEDAQWMMAELMAIPEIEVFIVTRPGRNPHITIPAKWKWVEQWFPRVPVKNFVTLAPKWLFRSHVIVDDFPDNVRKWQNCNPEGLPILVQRDWNLDVVEKFKKRGILVAENGVSSILPFIKQYVKENAHGL
jgi:5'(3')-deoxyribonucleotidase